MVCAVRSIRTKAYSHSLRFPLNCHFPDRTSQGESHMRLNLPIVEQLAQRQNILIAGMGGGFDVFCGLPLYFELEALGKDVHLANLSFSDIAGLNDGEELTDTLVGVTVDLDGDFGYFPEFYLAQWFYEERGE